MSCQKLFRFCSTCAVSYMPDCANCTSSLKNNPKKIIKGLSSEHVHLHPETNVLNSIPTLYIRFLCTYSTFRLI